MSILRLGRWLGIGALAIAYPLLAHYSTATEASVRTPSLGVGLALAPLMLIALVLAWRAAHRLAMLGLCALAGAALWQLWPELERNFTWVYFIQHAGTNAMLFLAFGRTLRQGVEPLCGQFARMVHGEIDATIARYTRQVTLAWTLFFAFMASLSCALFFFAPIEVWSVFANLLTLPLVALMFVVEFAIRIRLHPQLRSSRLIDGVRAYWKSSHAGNPTPSNPR